MDTDLQAILLIVVLSISTTNWKNSNYKKGYSYDVVAEFGVSGGYTNISKYVSSASASGSFNYSILSRCGLSCW